MSVRQIRRLSPALSAALLTIVLGGCQTLRPGATVTGSGDAAKDVPAVQAAVDAGGLVRLRGSFDFGDRGRVQLKRDVEIVGVDGATIRGGFFTFFSPLPESAAAAAPSPKIAIRNLNLDGALYGPINIGAASDLVISGNRITNLRPFAMAMPGYPDGQGMAGIFFGTAWSTPPNARRQYLAGVFSGRVLVEENVITLQPAQPTKTLGYGLMAQFTTGIDATVRRNTIVGATRTNIEFIDNYRGPDGRGRIRIEDNRLVTNEGGIPFPGAQTPNAILVGYFADRSAAQDPARAVDHVVQNNVIETRGAASMGVAVLTNRAKVTGNRITSRGEKAMPVMVAASDVEVAGNTVRGRGATAFYINGAGPLKGSGNRLSGNDVRDFEAGNAHVTFGKTAEGNTCSGQQFIVKVSDEGQGNRCP